MNYEYRKNILLYIFISFIIGSLTYVLINENKWLAIIIASCFFAFLIIKEGKTLGIIIFLFILIPVINSEKYYDIRINNQVDVRITKIYSYGGYGSYKGRLIYLEDNLNNYYPGDRIRIEGEFKEKLDYEKALIGSFKIDNIKELNGDFLSNIYKSRRNIFEGIRNKIGTRRAAIITSIAFGYTEKLDSEDTENMRSLGILHAVSVSGLHMVVIYSILKRILGEKIGRVVAGFYVLFTGAALSTIRSYIMIIITSLAKGVKRDYNPLAGLSLAGIIIILIKPNSPFDLGFQLSFLATFSIILFNKKLNKFFYKLPKYLRENISICLAAQVLTIPVLIVNFREFNLGFLLGNLILIPIINIIVITGNLLAITFKFKIIFNYLIFINYYLTRVLDYLSNNLMALNIKTFNLNNNIASFYIISLMVVYFYKKGYKNSIYFLLMSLIYIFTSIYSIFPKIEYLKEGALFIHYKSDKSIIYLKKDIDKENIRDIILPNNEIEEFNKIYIGNKVFIKKENNNLELKTFKENYYIRISREKIQSDYDIIDFIDGRYKKIIFLKDRAFKIY